ncbi:hypothetical protein [Persephonella sp.]|uniref:hypothetical protein n=1 Tax=Persephonella sp. TaxID=2060922 RepID=UPI0025E9F18E|nr:hypothetical protein [Persephonella sp.]
MKRFVFIFSIVLTVFLYGCEDKPSDSLVLKQLEGLNLIGEVKNYKRLNGYRDGNYYVVEFQYDLYIDKDKIKKLDKRTNKDLFTNMQVGLLLVGIVMRCGDKNPCTMRERLKFVKGEKGWSVVEE